MQSSTNPLNQDPVDVADALLVMLQKERGGYRRNNYLDKSPLVSDLDRRMMVDWCYNIVDICQFDKETAIMVSAPKKVKRHLLLHRIACTQLCLLHIEY